MRENRKVKGMKILTIKKGRDGKYRYHRFVVVKFALGMWIYKTSNRLVVERLAKIK